MRHSLFIIALLPSIAFAQRNAAVPDPDPEIERKSFIVAPGFEVTLWAADPLLAKPIQMNFDPEGRLWIASSEVYPQIKPGQVANDKILILEDTTGSGKADKTTIFADGLLIPTGVIPGDGGCYVANSTELLHFSASKPGQKADKKRVVLSGFGTEDTHHLLHTLRWGPDGALYFNQSVYIHSHIETPDGVKTLNGGGVWRYEPRTQKLEVFLRGFWNPWGHQFDKYGQSFLTDGAYGEGIVHGVPGASYPTGGNQAPRVLHGLNPGSPKFCGLEIISGRHFPDDWQGDCITNDFRGHRVCRFKLRDNGSTFDSREMTEVIKSNHPAFRPIDCAMGPDGALYIADWYNPIIQHGEVDFRDERRDKTHGRIWRVTAKDRPLVAKPKLVGATVPELLEQLKSPEDCTRRMAKQTLRNYKLEGDTVFEAWIKNLSKENELTCLETYWLCLSNQLRETPFEVWRGMTLSTNKFIKPMAGRYYGEFAGYKNEAGPLHEFERMCCKFITDDSARVRLEAIRALSAVKTSEAATLALSVLDKPMDATLDYALWLTLRDLEPYWLPAFQEGKFDYGNDMKKLTFALEAATSPDAIKPVVALLKANAAPEQAAALRTLLARAGGAEELAYLLGAILPSDAESKLAIGERTVLLQAIEVNVSKRNVARPGGIFAFEKLLATLPANDRKEEHAAARAVAHLIGHWKIAELRNHLEQIAATEAMPMLNRYAVLESLAFFNDGRAKGKLGEFAKSTKSPDLRRSAIMVLASIDSVTAAKEAASFLAAAPPGEEIASFVGVFLQVKNGASALAKALESTKLPADVAKIALKAVRNAGVPSPALTAALTKAGNLGAAKPEATPTEIAALAKEALATGNAARGELVFRRKEMQCFACHAIGGAGGQVGPDLTSIGASAQPDYIVESLLLPNKSIKEGYHTVDVTTLAGKIVSGVKVREGNGELVLRDKEDKEITLRLDDIDTRRNGRSLMPDGLTDPLTKAELLDLSRFLSELGKVGPYEPSKLRLVRRWENDGVNIYSRVSGELPLADVKTVNNQSVLHFRIAATAAGEVKLKVNSMDGLTLRSGAKEIAIDKPFAVNVGEQNLTVIVDRTKRNDALKIELEEVPGSTARASVVGGK